MDIRYETQPAIVGTLNALCPRCDTHRLLTKHQVTAYLLDFLPVPAGPVFQCSTCRTYSRKPSLFDRLLFTVALLGLLPVSGAALWGAVWMARGLIDAEERAPLQLWAMLLGLLLVGGGSPFFLLRSLVRLWRRPLTPVDEDSLTSL
jgi:hypothetical protein